MFNINQVNLVSVGKTEITQSLKTKDDAKAAVAAMDLNRQWKKKFDSLRTANPSIPVTVSGLNETVSDFRAALNAHMDQHLSDFLDRQSEEDLLMHSREYRYKMSTIARNEKNVLNFSEELGIEYPLPEQKSPGMTRKLNKVIIDALGRIRATIDKDLGRPVSQEIDRDIVEPDPSALTPADAPAAPTRNGQDIIEVTRLMIDAKNLQEKFGLLLLGEVKNLQEWVGGKTDITQYTKADLVDYIRTCLPYIPKNMLHNRDYKNKSLKECVTLTKDDPVKHVPISHRTCENRLAGLQMVFNYVKDDLGIISTNPAKGVAVPKVRVTGGQPRGYTAPELKAMWSALAEVSKDVKKRPERYWVPILGLYHGFRLNEICGLQVGDIYKNEDGIYVINLNENGTNKTLKNKSSVRVVPVHPYVLTDLKFLEFVETRKSKGADADRLFPNLTYVLGQGYAKKITVWFGTWKKTWLPKQSCYKHFHDLRYTFTQQAQNQAKMPDRCTQEITGHSIEGVSAVHLGYSGHLKPSMLLEELSKLRYGWE